MKLMLTMDVTAIMAPIDMSIPAVIMTRVKPTATMPVWEASWSIFIKFPVLKNRGFTSAMSSESTIMIASRTSHRTT
jgi:hypothetical protein